MVELHGWKVCGWFRHLGRKCNSSYPILPTHQSPQRCASRARNPIKRTSQPLIIDASNGLAEDNRIGKQTSSGAVSIEHSGAGRTLLARAMVQEPNKGYSSTVQFSAPQNGESSRFEGAGLRLHDELGEVLSPFVVARNVGDAGITLDGRMSYTTLEGEVRHVNYPKTRLASGEAKIIDLSLEEKNHLPPDVITAGLEFEHTGEPGSVVMAAHSMSSDGNQVFRVPLWDPLAQRSPTGGYPWYIEGNSSTTVYIKNITGQEQKYDAHLTFPGGTYEFGLKNIKGRQTVAIDLRELRDSQVPDEEGRTIPLDVSHGQIKWSLRQTNYSKRNDPYEKLALIGRSEQTDTTRGISSNYSCQNCCTDGFAHGYVSPPGVDFEIGQQAQFQAYEVYEDCYGYLNTNQVSGGWSSSNTSVVTVSGGLVTAKSIGDAYITASWNVTESYIDGSCDGEFKYTARTEGGEIQPLSPGCTAYGCGSLWWTNRSGASVSVIPKVTISGAQSIKDGETASFSVTVQGGGATGYLWTYSAPSGAGNAPNVTFSPSSGSSSVTTNGRWFASPNSECGAAFDAKYTIKCEVTFPNNKKKPVTTTLTVSALFHSSGNAGETVNPKIGGYPAYGFNTSRNLWVVTGTGTMSRQAPVVTIYPLSTSQFYQKTVAHENKHVDQYMTGMMSDLFTVSSLFTQLSPLTDVSQQGLITKINNTTVSWYNSEGAKWTTRQRASEQEAHGVSDPIIPKYLYQWNCVSSSY
jgi:hypothetical protein